MTDDEIIKYLEQAIDKYNKNEIFVDNIRLDKLSLDIIKRQQAEIERLKCEMGKLLPKDCAYTVQMEVSNKLETQIRAEAVREFAEPKERGADKPKITCLNCKHLMFSDMYGECNKQLRIVKPSDTCEYAELKERGGDK